MASAFTWLDTSDQDRRQVLDAIDRLKEPQSREELGLGTIRDGFAEDLFPGTSTIQTRAAYFLFVPWIYLDLHRRKVDSASAAAQGRKSETRLIRALLENEDTDGVIGKLALETLKRLPSITYWNGLARWGIRQFPGSMDEYHRQFERFREPPDGARDDDGQLVGGTLRHDWHPGLPEAPAEFPKVASLALRAEDREYLAERIHLSSGQSLLAWLLANGTTLEGDAPWAHPQADQFPREIRHTLEHARCFSEAMHGAAWLYNLMLAEELPEGDGRTVLVMRYRNALQQWGAGLVTRRSALAAWSRDGFWAEIGGKAHVIRQTRKFVDDWLALRAWEQVDAIVDTQAARQLIRHRERQLKGPRARLGNPRALELWGTDSGIAPLVYRWHSAMRILRDLRPDLGGANAQP